MLFKSTLFLIGLNVKHMGSYVNVTGCASLEKAREVLGETLEK